MSEHSGKRSSRTPQKKKPMVEPLTIQSNGKAVDLPKFEAHTLVRINGLWSVLSLRIKDREVIDYESTEGDALAITVDKMVRKILKTVRS